jgi:hypothetical protein
MVKILRNWASSIVKWIVDDSDVCSPFLFSFLHLFDSLSFPSTFICLILFRHNSTCMYIISKREDQRQGKVVYLYRCDHNSTHNNKIQIFKKKSNCFVRRFKKLNFENLKFMVHTSICPWTPCDSNNKYVLEINTCFKSSQLTDSVI